MYKFMTKHGTMIAFGIGLLIAFVAVMAIMMGLDGFNALPEDDKGTTSIFNIGIVGAIILVILCAVLMLGFGVYQLAANPKSAMKSIIPLAVIVGLVVVFYSMGQAETSGKVYEAIQKGELSGETSKWINGALATTLILFAGATLAFILSEIRNLFK